MAWVAAGGIPHDVTQRANLLAAGRCCNRPMKRKASFFLVLAVSILGGFVACPKIQIPQEVERPPREKVQQEKKVQERTIPQEAPRQKAIQKETTRQEATQKEITQEATQKGVAQKEGFSAGVLRKIIPQDAFTRTYATDFGTFYGQANAALQDHARTHKGNSFRVSRLGSDAVILRGVYLREGEGGPEKYVPILTIKPIASRKSQLQIKFDSSAENPSPPNPEVAAREIFQIIEKATGKAAR
jgi:hypothetical protein